MIDNYYSIKGKARGSYKERGSKFLAYAFPVSNKEDVKLMLESVRKEHYNARHHCYAYIIGPDEQLQKAYDDGEPRHAAGDPILNQIRSAQLKDILIVVARYFGGSKLGKSGLIQAYKSAAQDVLANVTVIEKVKCVTLRINFQYKGMNEVMKIVQQYALKILDQQYEEECSITCQFPKSEVSSIKKILEGHASTLRIEELPGG